MAAMGGKRSFAVVDKVTGLPRKRAPSNRGPWDGVFHHFTPRRGAVNRRPRAPWDLNEATPSARLCDMHGYRIAASFEIRVGWVS
jgi:hypothetical protein